MRFLLDTHTFIWWNLNPPPLPTRVFTVLVDPQNTIFLSLASIWEMQIKLLPITLPHILALEHLPLHHRDPFDRLLIAQAQIEDIPLLTHDPVFAQYPIKIVW